jgi:hypothetical protein
MYKQRSKRVGINKSAEARKAHYGRIVAKQDVRSEGPGKAFAGSRKNKHLPKHNRYTHKADWNKVSFGSHTLDNAKEYVRAVSHELVNDNEAQWDLSQGEKPNHKARAMNINDCFPPLVGHRHTDEQNTDLLDKIMKKFGR